MPRRAVLSLFGALIGVALLAVVWFLAFHVGFGERADASIFNGFAGLSHHPSVSSIAYRIATLCNPNPYVFLAAVPIVVALRRRRFRVATAIGAILLGANVTTHLLKPLLATPRAAALLPGTTPSAGSWPSGHATAAMALALCLVLAAPSRWRPFVAALGAAFAVAVSYSFLTLGWHYPSDVLGGFLVAGTWTLLGIAAVFIAEGHRAQAPEPESTRGMSVGQTLGPPAAALLAALALAVLLLIDRPQAVVSYARLHESFVIGAAAIGALGLTLATGVTLALRR
jgi:membrane-associated phospholipid phosphatase